MSKRVSPLDTGCYVCEAEPGEPCTTDSGRPAPLHASRRYTYYDAKAAELAEAGTDPDSLTEANVRDGYPDKSKKSCSFKFADGQSVYLSIGKMRAIVTWWEAESRQHGKSAEAVSARVKAV